MGEVNGKACEIHVLLCKWSHWGGKIYEPCLAIPDQICGEKMDWWLTNGSGKGGLKEDHLEFTLGKNS